MRVLEVLDSFYPSIDGPVNCIVNISKHLKKMGVEADLLVPNYPEKVNIDGLNIYRCKSMKGPEGYYVSLPKLDGKIKKLLKNGNYDLIHLHSPFTLGRYVILKAKKYGIPTILTMHTKYKSDFERKLKLKVLQSFMMKYIMKAVNNANYVSSVSNGAGETIKDYGYKKNVIHIIRNGTDLKPIEIENNVLEEIKNKYNLQNNFVFLFVGRIVENKNIQYSLETLSKLKKLGENNFKFLIVGSGDYENKLKEICKKLEIEENVVFLGRINDREYLSAIYKCANLFLFPSEFDTCGIVAIEAASMGLASAMLENTCASEMLIHKENGLVLPNNTDIWAKELQALMKDKPLQTKIQKNALKDVYHSWDDATKEYLDFYTQVLNKSVK